MLNKSLLNHETRLLLKVLQDSATATDVQLADPDKFLATCQRHRLTNIVCQRHQHQLTLLPKTTQQRFAEENRNSGLRQLQNISAMERLCSEFEQLGIRYQLIKGAPLAELLYQDVGARMSRDIDIIVYRPHFSQACAVVEKQGYQIKDLPTAMHHSYVNAADIIVELHTQLSLFGMGELSTFSSKLSALNSIIIAGRNYRLPDINEYFVYLCYHGATHGWYRLLWLVDVVEFRVQSSEFRVDFREVERIAQKYGLTDVVGQALALARDLLGFKPPDDFMISKRAEQLAADALELAIVRDCPLDDCFAFMLRPKREFLYQLRVQGSYWNRLLYLVTPTVNDRRQLVLPKFSEKSYYLIRPLLLGYRVLKKTLATDRS
ncbi:MAG: nucleotidyltransferase family protein [Bacillota bacterium]